MSCPALFLQPVSTLGAVSATGLTVGRGGTESGAGSLGSATNRKMRDDAPNRKKCHILRMEACCSAFFDNSDAVMDRDMAFLASNDASRAKEREGNHGIYGTRNQRAYEIGIAGVRARCAFRFRVFRVFRGDPLSAPRRK